jgi:hypothetical protein
VVEHTTCEHKIKGSNPATGIGREKMAIMAIMEEINVRKVAPIDISASRNTN